MKVNVTVPLNFTRFSCYKESVSEISKFFRKNYEANVCFVNQVRPTQFNLGMNINIGFKFLDDITQDYEAFIFHPFDECLIERLDPSKKDGFNPFNNELDRTVANRGFITNRDVFLKMNGSSNCFFSYGYEDHVLMDRVKKIGIIRRDFDAKLKVIYKGYSPNDHSQSLHIYNSDAYCRDISGLNTMNYSIVKTKKIFDNVWRVDVDLKKDIR